ncbi:TAXI family TRAP transporter solute-binding subunit [Halomonas sp. McH1-25]|uniref:TAXI family TRAP transporter solute-binding subunit n=1 Tax=unclassified Halomonas TaxID=2609666 RepID=UPI001EF4E9D9|nr:MULTISPECIES: TAXI family TRAP transporter solute-binding subunit [unclassified Halomonas]MCG7601520.1 TAXI family TRAP transporter solute-binding subunit [Halomonas sp. McH1-25]MCP1343929.1 TAXI family TRAP transporter solute-binding subunit [Halomonas sp. FL8]MCP1361536.1 TAXI family TRAP transporter solute-binding subunit [Halomonas sp. BBD45]MCP1363989.1 TAXI family TRAP transporter solute-binding subunit [Halomonas sp. BBD48]
MKVNSTPRTLLALLAATTIGLSTAHADDLVVSATSQTSDDYALAVAWSNQLARSDGDNRLTVVDNGSVNGLRQLASKRLDIAVIGAPHYLDAVNKRGNFSQDPDRLSEAYQDLRSLFAISTSAGQYVVREDAGIESFADLDGHSIAIGRPGGNAGRVSSAFLEAYGFEPGEDVDTQYIDYSDAFNQMSNGRLDGTFVWGGLPQAAIDNASRTMDLRFISPSEDRMDAFRENITAGEHYRLKSISSEEIENAYQGRVEADGDVNFWTFPYMFVVNKAMDEETAYELTKSLWNNLDSIKQTSAALNLLRRDEATTGLTAELHPGAERYFREIGLIE